MQSADEALSYGTPAWQWVPEVAPADDEPVLQRRFISSFEAPALEDERARLGATRTVLAGAASNWCIRATAEVIDFGTPGT